MDNNISTSTVKTMSSLELVKIINEMREEGAAELAHSDFLKKVVKVLGVEVAGNFSGYYTAGEVPATQFGDDWRFLRSLLIDYVATRSIAEQLRRQELFKSKQNTEAAPTD